MGLSGVLTWGIQLWTTSFTAIQIVEVFYSMYSVTEVAYFAYIYTKVPKEHYLTVTSHSRAALMIGRFLSAILGQLLLFGDILGLVGLNYITFGGHFIVMIVAFYLPKVERSIYFNPQNNIDCANAHDIDMDAIEASGSFKIRSNRYYDDRAGKFRQAFNLIWTQFKSAYSDGEVLIWSIWYACILCVYSQVYIYVQLLWNAIDKRQEVSGGKIFW